MNGMRNFSPLFQMNYFTENFLPERLVLSGLLLAATVSGLGDWSQFRGPFGSGHVPGGQALAVEWSEEKNVAWKVALPGRAWSSPVVLGDKIWLTTADPKGHKLTGLCVDANSGKIIFEKQLFSVADPQFAHKFNSYASPTPIVEKNRVYLTWGSPGTACLDTKTNEVLWSRDDFVCDHFRGAGSSPIIHKNLDPDGKPHLDGDLRKGYSTPHVIEHGGVTQLISVGAMAGYAYDPMTGRELWRVTERGQHSASTRPVYGHDMVFYPTGFSRSQLLAIDPSGRGEITGSHIKWRLKRSVAKKPSLLLIGELIFMIDDGGIASCIEAKSGKIVWSERVGGNFSSAPATDGERIFFFSEEGKTTALAASREFKVLAKNQLDGGFMASPAVHGSAWILRTKTHLYRLGER